MKLQNFMQLAIIFTISLFITFSAPVYAETIINDTDIGTDMDNPFSGDGIARGDGQGGDDINIITNNADIFVTGYGIFNFKGSIVNNGTIFSDGDHAVKFGDYAGGGGGVADTLTNYGTIYSESDAAVSMADGDDVFDNTGTVMVDSASTSIAMGGGNDTLNNTGSISIDSGSTSISFGSGEDTLNNSGSITIDYGNTGISFGSYGEDEVFNNSGTVTIGSAYNNGIKFGGESDISFTNSGDITIGSSGNNAIFLGYGSSDIVFNNSGNITIGSSGCHSIKIGYDSTIDFTNSGNITIEYADCHAIKTGSGSGDDSFINSGTLTIDYAGCHALHLQSGNDTMINSGTINMGTVGCHGIVLGSGKNTLTNDGTINMESTGGYGIHLSANSILTNSGTIDIGSSYNAAIYTGCQDNSISNTGTITIGSSSYHGIDLGSGDDDFTNSGTISITAANNNGIVFSSGDDTLTNSGTITIGTAECNNGISFGEGDDTLINTETGNISIGYGGWKGISFEYDRQGDDTLINNGAITITSSSGTALNFSSGADTLTNTGTITITSAGNNGIAMGNGRDTFDNSGAITITEVGGFGVRFGSNTGDSATLINSGSITIGTAGYSAFSFSSGDDSFTNTATGMITITSTDLSGISMGSDGGTADRFTNAGTINIGYANCSGIRMSGGVGIFENSGNINIETANGEAIYFDSDNDIFTNSGTITIGSSGGDDIQMGGGDDQVNLMPGSSVTGNFVGGAGTDAINLSMTGEISNVFTEFETLNKTGSGELMITGGLETDVIDATVSEGTLYTNSNVQLASLVINSGASFGGTTTIAGNVMNSGTIMPGSSIGTLSVGGDYTHDSGAVLDVEVGDNLTDLLDVTGSADLTAGGAVNVASVGMVDDGDKFDILAAAGGVTGAFSDVTTMSAVLSFTADYATDPNMVTLITSRLSYDEALEGTASSPNAVNMGIALQDFLASGSSGDLFLMLDHMNAEELSELLDQMSPDIISSFADANFSTNGQFTGNILERMSFLRLAKSYGNSSGKYANAWNNITDAGPVLARIAPERDQSSDWSVWARAFGGNGEQDNTAGYWGFDYDVAGANIGLDKKVSDKFTFGISIGKAKTDVDSNKAGSEGELESFMLGFYGNINTSDKGYIDTFLARTDNSYESQRSILGMIASGKHDGNDILAYVGGGYNMSHEKFNFIPTLSAQYVYHEEDGFIETGAGAMNMAVANMDMNSLTSRLGFRLNSTIKNKKYEMVPELRLQWVHEWRDTDRNIFTRFAGAPGGTLVQVSSPKPDRDSYVLGAGLNAFIFDSGSIFFNLNFDLEPGNSFKGIQYDLGLRFSF